MCREIERESECREIEKVFIEGKKDKERVCVERQRKRVFCREIEIERVCVCREGKRDRDRESMCREIERERECVCREIEGQIESVQSREREIHRGCVQRENVGRQRVYMQRDRERVCVERKRETEENQQPLGCGLGMRARVRVIQHFVRVFIFWHFVPGILSMHVFWHFVRIPYIATERYTDLFAISFVH